MNKKRGKKEYFYLFITLFFLFLSVFVIFLTIPFIFHKLIFSQFFDYKFQLLFVILFWLSTALILWSIKILTIIKKQF